MCARGFSWADPCERCAKRRRGLHEIAAAELHPLSPFQSLRVPVQMLSHERGDEIIAMVVTRLDAQSQSDPCIGTCALKQLRPQFLFDERVRIADIHEEISDTRAVFDQRNRVMLAPRGSVGAE